MGRPAKTVCDNAAYPPRAMRSDRAAAYLGMSQASFLRLVADNVFPQGVPIRGMIVWDRYDLDAAFENLKQQGEAKAKPRNSINEILGIEDGQTDESEN